MSTNFLTQRGAHFIGKQRRLFGLLLRFIDSPFPDDLAWSRGEQQHALAQSDCFADIVGDKNNRPASVLPNSSKFIMEQISCNGVQGGEWLIHQQYMLVLGERPGQSDSLTHTARKFVWTFGTGMLQMH